MGDELPANNLDAAAGEAQMAGALAARPLVTAIQTTLPVTLEVFFRLFFANGASYGLLASHAEHGDSELELSAWSHDTEHAELGLTRALHCRIPVVAPIGPKSTRATKIQRFKYFGPGVGCLIDSSTTMADIPCKLLHSRLPCV